MPVPLCYVQNDLNFPDAVDVVIIGGGIAGASATYELAKKGLKVALIEKGLIGAEQSSRNWGWCRQQNRDEGELPLAMYAVRHWQEVQKETGFDLGFRQTGLVYATTNKEEIDTWENWNNTVAKKYGMETHVLTAQQAKDLTPGSTTNWLGGIHSPTDGHAEPSLAAPLFATAAQKLGALIFQECAVRGLDITNGKVTGVITERGIIKTSRALLSAGAWSSVFCRRHGVNLPLGNVIGTAFRTKPIEHVIDKPLYVPGFACRPAKDGSYTMSVSGRGVLKPGFQAIRYAKTFLPTFKARRKILRFEPSLSPFFRGPEVLAKWSMDKKTPFEKVRIMDPNPDMAMVEEGLEAMRKEYPQLTGVQLDRAWGGLIDSTPDAVAVISPLKQLQGLFISAGFSAHGFGIGPGAGRLAADLVNGDTPIVDPTPFAYERFFAGQELKAPGLM